MKFGRKKDETSRITSLEAFKKLDSAREQIAILCDQFGLSQDAADLRRIGHVLSAPQAAQLAKTLEGFELRALAESNRVLRYSPKDPVGHATRRGDYERLGKAGASLWYAAATAKDERSQPEWISKIVDRIGEDLKKETTEEKYAKRDAKRKRKGTG